MTEQDPIRIARQSVDVFSHGDWDAFRAALAPDAVSVEPATGRRVQGANLLREWLTHRSSIGGRSTGG